jgi:signal transduction histidine kinase
MARTRQEVALLLSVLVVQVASPHAGGGQVSAIAGGIATVAAVGQVALLLGRRSRPVLVGVGVLVLYAVQVVAIDVVPPAALWVALWSVAGAKGQRIAAVLTAAAVAVLLGGELLHDGAGLGVLMAGVTVAIALAALLRRSERGRLDAVRAESATEERLRIARDLHDLVGHGLGVVSVQSSTARLALDAGDTSTARTALAAVELLGVLTDPSTAPAPGLQDIPALVDNLRGSGIDVVAHLDHPDVPASIGLAAYRVTQEALTNAVRHGQQKVAIEVWGDERLHVRVVSHGPRTSQTGGGLGLEGLQARVTALGGTSEVGPTDDGWSVVAELPLEAS